MEANKKYMDWTIKDYLFIASYYKHLSANVKIKKKI